MAEIILLKDSDYLLTHAKKMRILSPAYPQTYMEDRIYNI